MIEVMPLEAIRDARVLLHLGDAVTTDHISPAGSIARTSPAARYLLERGLQPRDFHSYGSRRGNDEVMARGTFTSHRLVNKLMAKSTSSSSSSTACVAPKTIHMASGVVADVFDVAQLYRHTRTAVIVLAGKDYGSGASRDWAAKGQWMLGVRAVLAESFDRVHRANLVSMGILPLRFVDAQSSRSLALTGTEKYTIHIDDELGVKQLVSVTVFI